MKITIQDTFIQELKELLAKHKAYISWNCGETSDTFGIYGESMDIEWYRGKIEIPGSGFGPEDL